MPDTTIAVRCQNLTIRVPGRTLVERLQLEIAAGDFIAVLGQNGAGKTLTMHTIAGLRAPDAGSTELRGNPIATMKRRQIAQHLA
ncbi:MAG: ATP-binding cassette domain-containing protein, partial [Woeseiaceae bacterium]